MYLLAYMTTPAYKILGPLFNLNMLKILHVYDKNLTFLSPIYFELSKIVFCLNIMFSYTCEKSKK